MRSYAKVFQNIHPRSFLQYCKISTRGYILKYCKISTPGHILKYFKISTQVIFYRVFDPVRAACRVLDYNQSVRKHSPALLLSHNLGLHRLCTSTTKGKMHSVDSTTKVFPRCEAWPHQPSALSSAPTPSRPCFRKGDVITS